ncbi:hypothetical protein DFH09DRAFT_231131 [Mycena vulgaris]|nr:hypothetical protein DFH09DRAFT_231131 [Mycena vulgaris]
MPPAPSSAPVDPALLCKKCAALVGTAYTSWSGPCSRCGYTYRQTSDNIVLWQPPNAAETLIAAEERDIDFKVRWNDVMTPRKTAMREENKVASKTQNMNPKAYTAPPPPDGIHFVDQAVGFPPQYGNMNPTSSYRPPAPPNGYQQIAELPAQYQPRRPPKGYEQIAELPAQYQPRRPPQPPGAPSVKRLVPLADVHSAVDPPDPIKFQTLGLMLIDLNHFLCHPHPPFFFRGTYSIVADPAINHAARVTSVAWELIRNTVLAFNVQTLAVHTSSRAARATTQSSAIWMGAPPDPRLANVSEPRPCEQCEHLLTIGADPDDSALERGLQGQRITVTLRHFPT